MNREATINAIIAAQMIGSRIRQNQIVNFFPDDGDYSRDKYAQHIEFFSLGVDCRIRCFMAANRTGKTIGGGYETALHLTGLYPDWWKGHRFDSSVEWWAAGDTNETVRDIVQRKLLGKREAIGEGLIPGRLLGTPVYRQNSNGAVDTVKVQHVSGRWSVLGFKSYEQGRKSFQGTEKHGIWLDEESNAGIREECLTRLMTTKGLLIETFTPLQGISEIVKQYLPEGFTGERVIRHGSMGLVMAGWDDVPHLDDETKAILESQYLPHTKDARMRGIPSLGSGAIYPVAESEIVVDDFEVPGHWLRCYAMDVGWKRTAAIWGAWNPDTDCLYLYSEYYRGQAEPSIHADAIRARKVPVGVIDPASRGRGQNDGSILLQQYRDLGLTLYPADNGIESGLLAVWQRLSTGRLKVFRSLQNWLQEYRMYRRDEQGRIVKENDHLMDATKYLVLSGKQLARPFVQQQDQDYDYLYRQADGGWMV